MKMNETILAQVRKSEEKYNIRYAEKDGSLFGGFRAAFFVGFVYAAVFAAFVLLGLWINGEIQYNLNTAYVIGAFLALGVAGCVFNAFRISIGTAVCSVPAGIAALIEFARLLPDPNAFLEINPKFYWAHLIPILTVLVSAVAMLVIDFRARHILKQGYKRISERIYGEYSAHAENLSEEEWAEFLKNYDPRKPKKQKPDKDTAEG